MNGGLPPPTGPRRLVPGRLFALGLVSGALILSTNPPARACPVTDVDCVVEKTQETAGGAQDTVEDTVEDGKGAVEDTTADVEETVKDATGDVKERVTDTIQDTVGTPDDTKPDPVTGPEVSSGSEAGDRADRVGGTKLGSRSRTKEGSGSEGSSSGRGVPGRISSLAASRAASAETDTVGPIAQSAGPGGSDLAEAAQLFAFPLVLSALIGLFLLLQNRVDGRDPKLALAPLDTEMVLFN